MFNEMSNALTEWVKAPLQCNKDEQGSGSELRLNEGSRSAHALDRTWR